MRVLVVDASLNHGLLLTQRLIEDGHSVVYAPIWGTLADHPFAVVLGKGLRKTKLDPEGWMRWIGKVDVATVTGVEHRGHVTDFLQKKGVPVCGPTAKACSLELSRAEGRKAFDSMGLDLPEGHRFTSPDDVATFVEKNPGRYVMKIDQVARAYFETFVGRDPEGDDVIEMALRLRGALGFADGMIGYYLEELTDGVEVGVGGFFNGTEIMGDLMVTYEGDAGYGYDLRLKGEQILRRKAIEKVLRAYDYRGSFDINGILTNKGYRPIEWTARWGSGTVEFYCHAAVDLGELLLAAATGRVVEKHRPELVGKFLSLVNVKDEDPDMEDPREVYFSEGVEVAEGSPSLRGERSSFWVSSPGRTTDGKWLGFPVLGVRDRRLGTFVGEGSTYDKAVATSLKLSDEAGISNTHIESGRLLEEFEGKVDQVYKRLTKGAAVASADEDFKLLGIRKRLTIEG